MAQSPNVRLRLANRAENVLLVRQALGGLADVLGLDAVTLNDISTAVTEACNNVVLHAYADGHGPLEVELSAGAEGLEVIVRDHGLGLRPEAGTPQDASAGIGLPVIQALADRVDLRDVPGGGTEVAMRFQAQGSHSWEPMSEEEPAAGAETDLQPPTAGGEDVLTMTLGPRPIARGVMPRVLATLAARAHFTTDRIADMQRLADALLAHADGSTATERVGVSVSVAPRRLDVRLGPLRSGDAAALLDATVDKEGLAGLLERLGEDHRVLRGDSSELLDLHLAQLD